MASKWESLSPRKRDCWIVERLFNWRVIKPTRVSYLPGPLFQGYPPDAENGDYVSDVPAYTTDANAALEVLRVVRGWNDARVLKFIETLGDIRRKRIGAARAWHMLELIHEVDDYAHAAYLVLETEDQRKDSNA